MAVFKRPGSPKFYMKFMYQGKQIFLSCKTTDKTLAKKREMAERVRLEKEGIDALPKPKGLAPVLGDYIRLPKDGDPGGEFWKWALPNYSPRPATLDYYFQRFGAIAEYALAGLRLSQIDEGALKQFLADMRATPLTGSTPRHNMMAVHLALKHARSNGLITTLPVFMKLKETPSIGKAISLTDQDVYMAAVTQDHRDFVMLLAFTSIEPGAAAAMMWGDVYFDPVGDFKYGYVYGRCEKNDRRAREMAITEDLQPILKSRWMAMGRPSSGPVFPAAKRPDYPMPLSTIQSAHKRLWKKTAGHDPLPIPRFRLYDLRHTALTRSGAGGASAYELQRMAGWKSARMAEKYLHLGRDSSAKASDHLTDYVREQRAKLREASKLKEAPRP